MIIVAVALCCAGVVAYTTWRIHAIGDDLLSLEKEGRAAGASFVETLQGAHVQRELTAWDQRRSLAVGLGDLRRNRFFGLFGLAAAALAWFALSVLSHVSTEVGEGQAMLFDEQPDASKQKA